MSQQRSEKEIDSELRRIEILDEILISLSNEFSELKNQNIKREDIFDALYIIYQNKFNWEHPSEFWSLEVNIEEAREELLDFDFNILFNKIEMDSNIIPRDLRVDYKVRIKNKGIWIIHKYDKDPFPSIPHAHLIDSNIKLDLSNGDCYRKTKKVFTIRKKDLIRIRKEAEKNFKLPELNV
ncbi:hypothetical protein [uncultured Christiangramia sp.]|uniref:hypothetical protein n=1 Tax=uncultured Christiangramia sp. TaxID=503836 RepID=UPI00263655C1|nr:hypothetical protein [uncultured Christiangramia sp.]